jgi:hypothetical protein
MSNSFFNPDTLSAANCVEGEWILSHWDPTSSTYSTNLELHPHRISVSHTPRPDDLFTVCFSFSPISEKRTFKVSLGLMKSTHEREMTQIADFDASPTMPSISLTVPVPCSALATPEYLTQDHLSVFISVGIPGGFVIPVDGVTVRRVSSSSHDRCPYAGLVNPGHHS